MEQFQNPVRTVEEEMSREQKFWKRNQLWTVLVAMVVLFGLLGGNSLSVAPGAEELTLIMHDDSAQTIRYDAIAELELLEDADYGVMHQGKDTRQGKSGTWEHLQWGSYTLCVYASSNKVVRITTETGCYLVNLASDGETEQLFQLLQDKMPASR
jgi:hypothetical protein